MNNYIICFFMCFVTCTAQEYPQDYFRSPLDVDLQVTGSFGELRFNQFHAGIDFSGYRQFGAPVFASADGVVNRIEVDIKGLGKSVSVKHPNGFTTVYGHLDAFDGALASYVKEHQYKIKKYDFEVFPLANDLPVKKGDIIGFLGNSGNSYQPHLHFEIRDTKSDDAINPLFFMNKDWIVDETAPVLNAVLVYPIDAEAVVNKSNRPMLLSLHKQSGGSYMSQSLRARGQIGFGINTYDILNNKFAKNGVYKIETFLNGTLVYEVIFDRFSTDQTRNVNYFVDYERLSRTRERIQKLFSTYLYDLDFIKKNLNDGLVGVNGGDSFNYRIMISDFNDNKTILNIPIAYSPQLATDVDLEAEQKLPKAIDYKRDYMFSEANATISWDAFTFAEDYDLELRLSENEVVLHKDEFPLNKSISIAFDMSDSNIDLEKAFIGIERGNAISYFYTSKRDQKLSARTKSLGTYKVFVDTVPPVIANVTLLKDNTIVGLDNELIFKVEDFLSGIKEINGYINDSWVLFAYDYKSNEIKHQLSDGIAKLGSNKVMLNVVDYVGNNTIFDMNFEIK